MGEVLRSSRFWISIVICVALFGFVALGKMEADAAVQNMVFLATGFGIAKAGGNDRLDKLIAQGITAALGKKDGEEGPDA